MTGHRKKAVVAAAAAQAAVAAAAVAVPWRVFPPCEGHGSCHYSFIAEVGMSAVVVTAAAMTVAAKGAEAPRLLSAVSFVCGVFMILFPSSLIGVCASPEMACRYGALPVWNLSGGLVALLSAAVFLAAREEAD